MSMLKQLRPTWGELMIKKKCKQALYYLSLLKEQKSSTSGESTVDTSKGNQLKLTNCGMSCKIIDFIMITIKITNTCKIAKWVV